MLSSLTTFGNDVYGHYGRQLITRFDDKLAGPNVPGLPLPPPIPRAFVSNETLPDEPIGILGAGATGLYTALILEDLGIPYQILEARDRVGGRLFTYEFPNQAGAPYNYFDIGAMRFPNISSMARVFNLFEYPPLNSGEIQLKQKLSPFYFRNENNLFSYNGVTVRQGAVPSGDPFNAKQVIMDTDPDPYVSAGVKAITDDVLNPFATRLLDDLKNHKTDGWEYMKSFDQYSTRAYMSVYYRPSSNLNLPNQSLPTGVVNWLETFDKSTGWYDRALSETVLEAVAFGWQPSTDVVQETPWWCIDGGSSQISESMAKYIRNRKNDAIILSKRVTNIGLDENAKGDTIVDVITDGTEHHRFSHVVSSIPLPVLRVMDLSKAALSPMQSNALRQLNYGPSVKIGMQFKSAWWTNATDKDGRPLNIIGGQTYTDRPLRTIVYPSFGDVKAGKTTTLIASYCWTEDSERLGALIGTEDDLLKEFVLKELASIHNIDVDFLRNQLLDTFSWSWSHDPYTMGAFAFFGPGKYDQLYTSLTNPAGHGRLHFAGEAISLRHAWVEGALDSAWRAVAGILSQPGFTSYQEKFYQNWGVNAEWFTEDVLQSLNEPQNGSQTSTDPTNPDGSVPPPSNVDKIMKGNLLFRHHASTGLF